MSQTVSNQVAFRLSPMSQVESSTGTILIVDDNPTNLEVLSLSLKRIGHEILVALDGESAIEQIEYAQPDLILLDVMMPGIDGFETCRRLKANRTTTTIPIIFMTALSDTVDKVQGFDLGAVDYITKPFQQEEVVARIETHLKICHLNQQLSRQNLLLKEEVRQRIDAENALQELVQQLEDRVNERTAELLAANKQLLHSEAELRIRTLELEASLKTLQSTQAQLIQSEKMSSLGQLVAGIAHEINNPINFIYGNFGPASDYIYNLLHLLESYQNCYPDTHPDLLEEMEEIDFNFIKRDLPKILDSMKIGADRIRTIVLSLRNFSRLDESEFKAVNIHEGIDSTLMILQHRFKATSDSLGVNLVKNYGDLPLVDCYPSQLNQVFMNIISNALDALEERDRERSIDEIQANPSTIEICTQLLPDDKTVSISIKDNGSGIKQEIASRLFDPFFTTKPVGKGTGLGLSISHQIVVEKHGGNIYCESVLGEGSKFVVEIPLQQLEEDAE